MHTTYLAIFQIDPHSIKTFSELLSQKFSPEEMKEKEEIATRLFTNPESVTEAEYEKALSEDGQARVRNLFQKKLEKVVKRLFKDHSDGDDLAWGVFRVMMSEDFFASLNPDNLLDFSARYPIDLHPEGIILPDCTLIESDTEEVMRKYKENSIFVFLDIDF